MVVSAENLRISEKEFDFYDWFSSLDNRERGGLEGLLDGLKSACIFNRDTKFDVAQINKFLADQGIELVAVDNILINPKSLQERLKKEKKLAKDLGWDFQLGFYDNVQKMSGIGDEPLENQALLGFALGFPESALRGYIKAGQMEREYKTPRLFNLLSGFFEGSIREEDQSVLAEMQEKYLAIQDFPRTGDRKKDSEVHSLMTRQLVEAYQQDLRDIYRNNFVLLEKEIDFLMSETGVSIFNYNGDQVFVFVSFNENGQEPDDVKKLRDRVR